MQAALKALNQLALDGVIAGYAIGGAIGASFYIDAVQTEDIDAFVFLPVSASGLVSLTPVYAALQQQGGEIEGAHVRFGNWPLQILSDANALIAEAIEKSVVVDYNGVPTRVFLPEYLCAIALQTSRAKDDLRVRMFLEQKQVDITNLRKLSERFELTQRLERLIL